MSSHRRRRSFAVAALSFVLRGIRILLMAFAAIGPAPPPRVPKGRDPTEQVSVARPAAGGQR